MTRSEIQNSGQEGIKANTDMMNGPKDSFPELLEHQKDTESPILLQVGTEVLSGLVDPKGMVRIGECRHTD